MKKLFSLLAMLLMSVGLFATETTNTIEDIVKIPDTELATDGNETNEGGRGNNATDGTETNQGGRGGN